MGAGPRRHQLRVLEAGFHATASASGSGWSVSHLENHCIAPLTTWSATAWHFTPPSRPPCRAPHSLPMQGANGGASAEEAVGGGSLTLDPGSPGWVRESGPPGKKDKRTLTKQPTCKLMERKVKLLQVLRECTTMGRQAVVWRASVSPLEGSSQRRGPWVSS